MRSKEVAMRNVILHKSLLKHNRHGQSCCLTYFNHTTIHLLKLIVNSENHKFCPVNKTNNKNLSWEPTTKTI